MDKANTSSKSLREIQKALDSALDQKLITTEGYDQIRAAMAKKMKKKSLAFIVEDVETPPQPETVEYVMVEEKEDRHPYDEAPCDTVLAEESAMPLHDEEPVRDQSGDTDHHKGEGVPEAVVDATSLGEDLHAGQGGKSGFGFTWCIRCARVDVILYGSKTLPAEMRGADHQLDNGIATIMCGHCKSKGAGNQHGRYNGGLYGQPGVGDFRSNFEKLKLSPVMFGGSEVARAARVISSSEVPFITVNDGVAFKDIDEIVRRLTVKDRVMSVDMKGLREGKRENLLLPYLAGGLTA